MSFLSFHCLCVYHCRSFSTVVVKRMYSCSTANGNMKINPVCLVNPAYSFKNIAIIVAADSGECRTWWSPFALSEDLAASCRHRWLSHNCISPRTEGQKRSLAALGRCAGMGCRLWTGNPPRLLTSHKGLLSLASLRVNRVKASAGINAGTSPLSGGR